MKSLHQNHDDAFSVIRQPDADVDSSKTSALRSSGVMEVVPGALMALVNYLLFSVGLMLLARYVVDQKLFGVYSAAVAAITADPPS